MEFKNLINAQNASGKSSGLKLIEAGYVAYLGSEPKLYYPKAKDKYGNKIKDSSGKDVRSDDPSGYQVSFATIGDNPRIVSAVFPSLDDLDLEALKIYQLSGYGYDIRQSNFIWLEEVESFELVNLNG